MIEGESRYLGGSRFHEFLSFGTAGSRHLNPRGWAGCAMNTLHRIAWRLLLLHSDASRDVFGAGAGCGRASRSLRFCQRRLKKLQTWRVKMLHPAEVTSL